MSIKANETTQREKVLKKIRRGLVQKTKDPFQSVDFDSNVFQAFSDMLEIEFAQRFIENGGRFVFCEDPSEVKENLQFLLEENKVKSLFCSEESFKSLIELKEVKVISKLSDYTSTDVVLMPCEALIARHGGIWINNEARKVVANSRVLIVLAYTTQLKAELKDVLKQLKGINALGELASCYSLLSGPTRTADIENELFQGIHGPEELYLFLIDNGPSEKEQ